MTVSKRAVLVYLVDEYAARFRPLSVPEVAAALDATPADVGQVLERLEALELAVAVEGGYRPTVTARELVDLGVLDDSFVVLDPIDDRESSRDS